MSDGLKTSPFRPWKYASDENQIAALVDAADECGDPAFSRAIRAEAALRRIMLFGYGDGHARGFTCADMAADALGLERKARR